MSSEFNVQCSKLRKLILLFLLFFVFCTVNCSIPNLEDPACGASKGTVKKFYSYHFGNDMKFTKDNLAERGEYLTDELRRKLSEMPDGEFDYFTQTADYPKAFRIGECKVISPEKTVFQIVLFWKTPERSEQREVYAEMVKQNNEWLINSVNDKK